MYKTPFNLRQALLPLLALAGLVGACAGAGEEGENAARGGVQETGPTEVWRLSQEPLLEIGVREGEEEYQFFRVGGSVRLADGRIVVANTGGRELRVFGPDGSYEKTIGRDGEGPGEFRWPTRIRMLSPDSLMVWDQSLQRISFFDGDGRFLSMSTLNTSSENLFPGDEWLLGRDWIDSPLAPGDRGQLLNAVEALPPVDSVGTLRFVKVTNDGWLWVSSVRPPADSTISWQVYDLQGRQVAQLQTPPRFQPHEIGPDYVLGRYLDELDINFVRLYALEGPRPELRAGIGFSPSVAHGSERGTDQSDGAREPVSEEVMANMRSILKNMASMEEIYYADNMTYTTDLSALEFTPRGEAARTLDVQIPFAGTEGWMVILTHRSSGRMCAMVYGYFVPMGWTGGQIICP